LCAGFGLLVFRFGLEPPTAGASLISRRMRRRPGPELPPREAPLAIAGCVGPGWSVENPVDPVLEDGVPLRIPNRAGNKKLAARNLEQARICRLTDSPASGEIIAPLSALGRWAGCPARKSRSTCQADRSSMQIVDHLLRIIECWRLCLPRANRLGRTLHQFLASSC